MKIFGIGLSKTGITSLGAALETLGFSVKQFPLSLAQIVNFDAAIDTSVAVWYRELDKLYPGARFIYTTREKSSWLRSCQGMWRRQSAMFKANPFITDVHQALSLGNDFDGRAFQAAYEKHDRAIKEYFNSRKNDLLVLDLHEPGDKWAALCDFLHAAHPGIPWPAANKSATIERLACHVLRSTRDPQLTAALAGIPEAELLSMDRTHGDFGSLDEMALIRDKGWEIRHFIARAVQMLGTPQNIASRCSLSLETVQSLIQPPAK